MCGVRDCVKVFVAPQLWTAPQLNGPAGVGESGGDMGGGREVQSPREGGRRKGGGQLNTRSSKIMLVSLCHAGGGRGWGAPGAEVAPG